MQHMQKRADLPASQQRQCRILMPLVAMGANELADVITSADGKMVMSIHDLRRKYGTHAAGPKQEKALYKLAHMLHTEQPVGKLTRSRTDKGLY
jgi:S1-C subfamily serine protease